MAFRDQLVAALTQALTKAVDEALGVTPAKSAMPTTAPKITTGRRGRPAGSRNKATAKPKGKAESYRAGDVKARRLPTFVRDLLGGELKKAAILAKYGPHFTFSPTTTKEEIEAAAKAWASEKSNPKDSVKAPRKVAARRAKATPPKITKRVAAAAM
jgi:hypothetical protein